MHKSVRPGSTLITPNAGNDCALTVCRLMLSSQELGLQSGILLAVPIPAAEAASGALLAAAKQTALAEAEAKGVTGRDVTPYLLSR